MRAHESRWEHIRVTESAWEFQAKRERESSTTLKLNLSRFKFDESAWESLGVRQSFRPNQSEKRLSTRCRLARTYCLKNARRFSSLPKLEFQHVYREERSRELTENACLHEVFNAFGPRAPFFLLQSYDDMKFKMATHGNFKIATYSLVI